MTVVLGTAGHIDHGKTTLLRALTGLDPDRLPEEQRRGMTIDVGFAHLLLDDDGELDFVDVPGHDRLVGNMLVGAGEIDGVVLVVAADDGPRAQTLEHLALLDALDHRHGLAVVTKIDAVDARRVDQLIAEMAALLARTSLAGIRLVPASGRSGEGIGTVREALLAVRDEIVAAQRGRAARPPTLAIDRVFSVRGRGAVVTGSLRGGRLAAGDVLRLVPGEREVRVREVQVHGRAVAGVDGGGRTALNLASIGTDLLHRGQVLTADPAVAATERALVTFRGTVADRFRARLHAGTAAVDAVVSRSGRDALAIGNGTAGIVRLAAPVALRPGDRFVLRQGSARLPVGGMVLDVAATRGLSRRRQTADRVDALARAVSAGDDRSAGAARLDLHGAMATPEGVLLAPDVGASAVDGLLADLQGAPEGVAAPAAAGLGPPGAALAVVRQAVVRSVRRQVTLDRDPAASAAAGLVDDLVRAGRLVRVGDRLGRPGSIVLAAASDPAAGLAMARLEALLNAPAPPPLGDAARQAGCSPDGIRALERAGRIVVLEPDLAYAMTAYRDLAARALTMAARTPLTPAAFRDATGTSRKYVLAVLEDLDRRAILRRTPDGHLPGPKAPAASLIPSPTSAPP